ncbi:hypothetical protein LTR62_005148 [Meristemomyces frigidus]|uniref:Uncharacterized protein n=1 Tax=Meristemomyces frigidus TaxID=1508187 RepID=A0AAN7TR52_9PEZI|nr:hypothetical protein LTR62_005148 [Meristemomyces frigidus]
MIRRRTLRPAAPSHLNISHRPSSIGGGSSQEEYEESESESDRVMTSSGEIGGLQLPGHMYPTHLGQALPSSSSEGRPQREEVDDEDRTAVNRPTGTQECFTPQPNAFSHPPSAAGQARNASAPVPGSYFPSTRPPPRSSTTRQSYPNQHERQSSHMPQNILSPSYNAAVQHDEALRASLTTLLSIGAAARSLAKPEAKRPQTATVPTRAQRIEPMSFRLIPESELPTRSPPIPTFQPTIRRTSTSTSASSALPKENKRKAGTPAVVGGRSSSRERRALKKARTRSTTTATMADEWPLITPTLLTWVVSAGVVVFLSALSFSAGYCVGKEAGRLEGAGEWIEEPLRGCARSSGGLRRGVLREVVQV